MRTAPYWLCRPLLLAFFKNEIRVRVIVLQQYLARAAVVDARVTGSLIFLSAHRPHNTAHHAQIGCWIVALP